MRRLPPGGYRVRVVPGEGEAVAKSVLRSAKREGVWVSADSQTKVEISLERGVSLDGIVVDDVGHPVEGASVLASPPSGLDYDRRSAVTDARGRFRIQGLPPGSLAGVSASKNGFLTCHLKEGLSTGMMELRVTLRRPLRLRGRVVHVGTDQPAREFWVKVSCLKRSSAGWPKGPQPYLPPKRFFDEPNGRFSTRVFGPGVYRVVAGTKEGKRTQAVILRVEYGEPLEPANLVLRDGCELTGRVITREKQPVEGVQVRLFEPIGHGRVSIERASTDKNGAFRFTGLGSGPHLLRSFRPGMAEEEAMAVVELGPGHQSAPSMTLRACGSFDVHAVDKDGRPFSRVRVDVRRTFGPHTFPIQFIWVRYRREEAEGFYVTDQSGRTLPRHLLPGVYTLEAMVVPPGPIGRRPSGPDVKITRRTFTVAANRATKVELQLDRD